MYERNCVKLTHVCKDVKKEIGDYSELMLKESYHLLRSLENMSHLQKKWDLRYLLIFSF